MACILINHASGMPNRITGISVYTWSLLEALVKAGRHEYVLSTNWDIDRLPANIAALGMKTVHRATPGNETLSILKNTVDLPALKTRTGCDAVFHPQPLSTLFNQGPDVVVIHDLYRVTHSHLFNWKQRLQWQHVVARGIRGASWLIAVSEATRQATVDAYPEVASRISVVHEASPLAPSAIVEKLDATAPYALMVANITPNKNVGVFIEALKLLADRGDRPKVFLVGRDEYGVLPGLLAGRNDLDLHMLQNLSDDALRALYAGARVYVNTSLVEGFCLPLLEAQALGTPVICSDLPVLREVAGNGAIFVDPHSPHVLAEKVSEIFRDDRLYETIKAEAQHNVSRFSWEKAAIETEEVIDLALSSNRRGVRA